MTLRADSLTGSLFRGHTMRSTLKKAPLVVAFWMLSHGGDLAAQDFTPSSLTDSVNGSVISLRDAVIAANASSTVDRIVLGAGTYTLSIAGKGENAAATGDLDITRPVDAGVLTIEGVGADTVIDAAQIDRVFDIYGSAVTFKNLTIKNGLAPDAPLGAYAGTVYAQGGGILSYNSTLILDHVTLDSNEARGGVAVNNSQSGGFGLGGGIYAQGGSLTLANSTLNANKATGGAGAAGANNNNGGNGNGSNGGYAQGGAIMAVDCPITATSSAITNNTAIAGAGGAGGSGASGSNAYGGGFGGTGGNAAGAGIYAVGNSPLSITDSSISGNANTGGAGGAGGAGGYNFSSGKSGGSGGSGGDATGGGFFAQLNSSSTAVTISTTNIVGNSNSGGAGGTGGVGGNSIDGGGGIGGHGGYGGNVDGAGLKKSYNCTLTVTSSTIAGNSQTAGNGGAGAAGGTGSSHGSGGYGNNGGRSRGAGAWAYGGTFIRSTISGNTGTGGGTGVGGGVAPNLGSNDENGGKSYGGGIYSYFATETIGHCTISGNTVKGGDGGIGGNGGAARGGGLFGEGLTLSITNSTIVGNSATGGGTQDGLGAIGITEGGGIYLPANIVCNNSQPLVLVSSIVAQNMSGTTPEDAFTGLDVQSTNNLIGSDSNLNGTTNGSNGNKVGTIAAPLDPKLSALDDHGGPTSTHALLAGSPALESGLANDELVDQRGAGFPRVVGVTDIGAFEAHAPTADAGGPYTITVGQGLTVDGSKSADIDKDPLTYTWDINGDGTFGDATGVNPTLTPAQMVTLGLNTAKVVTVAIKVSDGINTATATATLTINAATVTNPPVSPPTLSPNDPSIGQTVTVTSGTSFDWGDGTTNSSSTHTYAAPGTYLVSVTSSDGSTTKFTVVVSGALNVISLKGALTRAVPGRDLVRLQADIVDGSTLKLAGQPITIDIGGAKSTFTIADDKIRKPLKDHGGVLKVKHGKKDLNLWVSMLGTWLPEWQDEHVARPSGNEQVPTTMPVTVTIGTTVYKVNVTIFLSPYPRAVWLFDNVKRRPSTR